MEYSQYLPDEVLWIEADLQYLINEKAYGYNAPSGFPSYRNASWAGPRKKGKALALLLSTVSTKVAAANMTNKQAAKQVVAAADNGISQFLDSDDICPPWPYPGPPIPLVNLASELTFVANTLQDGNLRAALLGVVGQVLDRAYALTTQAAGA
jgi:hypothetical protein